MGDTIHLQPGEKVLLKVHKHWMTLAYDVASSLVLIFLPALIFILFIIVPPVFPSLVSFATLLSVAWLLVIWITLLVIWTDYYLDLWIITDKHIISVDQVGLFNRKVTSVSLEQIQEITVHTQGPIENVLNFGTIEIETAGPESDTRMGGVPDPERVRGVILEHIKRYEELLRANQNQEKLLHSISHEMKGYLSKDAAALASIAEGDYDAKPAMLKSVAGSALSQTRKAVKTVINILDSSDFSQGEVGFSVVPFDLAATVRRVVAEYALPAEKRGLTLTVDASAPCTVHGDEEKMDRLVVRNLLDNALHYTPGGSISAAVSASGGVVRLTITDTGVGITKKDMEHLFEEGGKGEDSTSINPESTGYGLAEAKRTIEAHGGRIWAESDGKGKGSTFIVELPAAE